MPWYAWLLSAYVLISGCERPLNPSSPKSDQIALGKKLFFEPRLSAHGKTSCATCHIPSHGFAEPVPSRSIGFQISRNTPGLWAVGKRTHLHWDGGVPDLESQALGPLQSQEELGLNLKLGVARLKEDVGYKNAFESVYGGPPDVSFIVQSLAAFQRSLDPLFFVSPMKVKTLRPHFALFLSLGCGQCHAPPYFFKDEFIQIGGEEKDPGRGRITGQKVDMGRFRIPSLWAVGLTAPYFHDGRHATMEEAIQGHGLHVPKISPREMDSLLYFLRALHPESL